MRSALIILSLAVLTGVATATPSDDFDSARAAYRRGQYSSALPLFNSLLYPPPPRLASDTDLAEAYLALGVCRYETGDTPGARREFEQALLVNSNVRIDPLIVTDSTAIDAFNETRLDMQERIRAEAEKKRRAELLKLRESYVGVETHQFYLNFVPFGVGQYQNKDIGKGIFFTAAEGTTLITSAAIWAYLVNTYGIRSTRVAPEDANRVLRLQQVEIGAGVAFLGLWVLGAVDAYLNFTPQTRVEIDESVLPPELRGLLKPDSTKKRPAPKTSFHVLPMFTPDGAGIGLSWEH
ncbi:MAG: hypothetical protein QM831_41830 [Kofleriaceae bacterium]